MQASLDFGRGHRVEEATRRVLRAVADAVDAIGLIQAAGACDARKSELSDALAAREGRYLRVEWVLAILDIAPGVFRDRIASALIEWVGLGITEPLPMTPEQKLARLEQRISARFGAAGAEIVEENRK